MAVGRRVPPARPARPARPALLPPRDMRSGGAISARSPGRIALLHALAHIELNAIDLAWDIVARFARCRCRANSSTIGSASPPRRPSISRCSAPGSRALGAAYGDLPAHDGLWEAAAATAHDLLARLAVVPLVLEARGLDVTPEMIRRLERAGDAASAAILRPHLSRRDRPCRGRRALVRSGYAASAASTRPRLPRPCARYFTGALKPPFNQAARDAAGFPATYYQPLACPPVFAS